MARDLEQLRRNYERDGVVHLPRLLTDAQVHALRVTIARYIRDDLPGKPADACTYEADGITVRNLWRLEQHHPTILEMVVSAELTALVEQLVHGPPVLAAVETFNKPARGGSAVPYHQDNAYFCRTPPDMLTVWIAIDPVTTENGPVHYIRGSHKQGLRRAVASGVPGNSMGLAEDPDVPLSEQYCGLLEPGDALIHHCETIHHSGVNQSDRDRLGLLLVYRGEHTQTDPELKAAYDAVRR